MESVGSSKLSCWRKNVNVTPYLLSQSISVRDMQNYIHYNEFAMRLVLFI